MRIAIVAPLYRPAIGGVRPTSSSWPPGVAAAGEAVDVLTQTADPGLPSAERLDGVLVRRFRVIAPSDHYALAPGLARHLRRHGDDYDLIHAHNYQALPALLAAATVKPPLVFTPHYHGGSDSAFRNALHRPYRLLGSRIFWRAAKVIAVAPDEASIIAEQFPTAAAKVVLVPNGVDAERISAAAPFEHERSSVVLCAGRIDHYSGWARTIGAFAHLDRSYVLRITGEGPARGELESLVGELGLGERVRFLGWVEVGELYRWLRTADAYVTMSEIEAMGLTALEALYAGARVVANDIPAHSGTARFAGERLRLVPLAASPEYLAAAIRDAAESDPPGGEIPTWDTAVASTMAVYREALG